MTNFYNAEKTIKFNDKTADKKTKGTFAQKTTVEIGYGTPGTDEQQVNLGQIATGTGFAIIRKEKMDIGLKVGDNTCLLFREGNKMQKTRMSPKLKVVPYDVNITCRPSRSQVSIEVKEPKDKVSKMSLKECKVFMEKNKAHFDGGQVLTPDSVDHARAMVRTLMQRKEQFEAGKKEALKVAKAAKKAESKSKAPKEKAPKAKTEKQAPVVAAPEAPAASI